jgi:AbrB family looped-hinge helix DNA binding protein
MFQVKVDDDYSITIPDEIVEKMGLKEGDLMDVTIENGQTGFLVCY